MALVCKICGYKQYDEETIKAYKEEYPDMEEHDIPYECGACMDNPEFELCISAENVISTDGQKKLKTLECYINCGEEELVIEAIDDEGHKWCASTSLTSLFDDLSQGTLSRIYDIIKEAE